MARSARLSKLVNFADLEGSDRALREALAGAAGDEKLAVETQLARVLGLDGDYDQALELLQRIREELPEGASEARVRVELEEGRCHRDLNREDEAIECFDRALGFALEIKDDYLAMDAAHMLAVVGDYAHQVEHGERALKLVDKMEDFEAKYWVGPISNNLGWTYFEAEEYEQALTLFKRSVDARVDGPKKPYLIARYAVARTLRALGRYEEAYAVLPELQDENVRLGSESPFVNEEIAECLFALGKPEEAKPFFKKASEALSKMHYLIEEEPDRIARLADLGR